jgi:hypothetical protein
MATIFTENIALQQQCEQIRYPRNFPLKATTKLVIAFESFIEIHHIPICRDTPKLKKAHSIILEPYSDSTEEQHTVNTHLCPK